MNKKNRNKKRKKYKKMIQKRSCYLAIVILIFFGFNLRGQESAPEWIHDVGAKSFPKGGIELKVNDFGAINNGLILSTLAIQSAIDSCAKVGGGKVIFNPGSYLTGAIYLKENVNLHIGENVELRGIIDVAEYPEIDTRVAGVEMRWPSAIINVLNQKNAAVTGSGSIHAQGRENWERYWKLRVDYTPRGLRWAADYDCKRVRTVLVSNSENISLKNITLKQAGFWTVHVLYSKNITIDGLIIKNNIDGNGPSTDGVDIDSSEKILVQNCDIDCNDDNFCLKAGRDFDGLRVNRPTEYIVIRDCISRRGGGLITLGSETSGGIRNVYVTNMEANETNCAIRLKSALTRGGVISDILIENIKMKNVNIPLEVSLNWNPSYSYASIGDDVENIPDYWEKLLEKVDPEKGIPHIKNVTIRNIKAKGVKTAISVSGVPDSYIENFTLENIQISCENAGKLNYTKNWTFNNVKIKSKNKKELDCDKSFGLVASKSDF